MSALQEWYRYVDSLVRPSRRFEELEEWWIPEDAAQTPADARQDEATEEPDHASAPTGQESSLPTRGTQSAGSAIPLPASGLAPRVPAPAPVDPHAVIAQLARRADSALPGPQWEPASGSCPVPALDQFIPQFGPPAESGAAARDFIETIAQAYGPRPEAAPAAPRQERLDLPSIATIREGLPRTMQRLLQIPITEEVAQHSYKSKFRETREELIQRLFDPPLTLEDTARLLGVCPTTVRRYTNKGLLRHYRTQGNQRRFRLSDLLAFLERWGDAGPEAGALGGSASTARRAAGTASSESVGSRSKRPSR